MFAVLCRSCRPVPAASLRELQDCRSSGRRFVGELFRNGHRNRAARARMTVETETQPTETETHQIDPELVSSLLTDESFRPAEPTTLEDTGLSETLVESLICKRLAVCGSASGREVAKDICLP